MKKTRKPVFYMLLFAGIVVLIILIMQPLTILHFGNYISVLFPSGIIALKERNLLFILQALMLLVIIPVYILTFVFSWRYSAQNPKGEYDPDLVDNRLAEYIWWGLPLVMTSIACALAWIKTEQLDPFKPIESNKKALRIQVVALQWKWLFLYPEEGIASVNFLQIPKETPIHFEITADAPMNSFWIPNLSGQIYAMPRMKTELYLMANEVGDFRGSSANISGKGFSSMHFITRASSEEDYHRWLETAKRTLRRLDLKEYERLAAPSSDHPVEIFKLQDQSLFNQIIDKYMHP
jgi:cytochrome o ubiquinol oxidase subunit 2